MEALTFTSHPDCDRLSNAELQAELVRADKRLDFLHHLPEKDQDPYLEIWLIQRLRLLRAELNRRNESNGDRHTEEPLPQRDEENPACELRDSEDFSEVDGELPPLTQEGPRIMACVRHKYIKTRFGEKDYLYWRDEETGLVLPQYFRHYERYPVGSKAVRTFITAMGVRPKRVDRLSLKKLVGLRARVFVETVRPTYGSGALKGQPMPESLNYSKVAEILEPLGRVDLNTMN